MRYVNNYLRPTETYPANPNGSPCGIAGALNPPNPPSRSPLVNSAPFEDVTFLLTSIPFRPEIERRPGPNNDASPRALRLEPGLLGPERRAGGVGGFRAVGEGLSECEEVGWMNKWLLRGAWIAR